MFCSKCGTSNPDDGRFCLGCGTSLQAQGGIPAAPPAVMTPPVPGLAPPYAGPAPTSGKAIGSLICGFLFWIFPAAVVAIILGHLSLSEINRAAGRLKGRGLAMAGLVLGYGGILFIPFILIIAAIAIPNLLRARTAANEASAAASLRTIAAASFMYRNKYSNGYPPNLSALDGSYAGTPNCEHAQLIDRVLASGRKSGYVFEYVATGAQVASVNAKTGACPTAGTESFHVDAYPIARGTTGLRSFYVDETAVIRVEQNGPASADSPALGDGSERF